MAITLNVNGTDYVIPEKGDAQNSTPAVDWGVTVTQWMSAVTAGMLQSKGGAFPLGSEVDFGATYGLKSAYYKSRAANPAASGIVRLGNTESVKWRNAANSADLALAVSAANKLTYEGIDLQPLTTRGDLIVRGASDNIRLALGASGLVLKSDGTDVVWGSVAGTGDVVGPSSAVDENIPVFDGVTGKLVKDSGFSVSGISASAIPPKPMIYQDTFNTTEVKVFATAAAPARVIINGTVYTNTSDKVCDSTVSGRNGYVDSETSIRYLYAIPPTSGTTFDVVMSSVDPGSGGPTGFPNWSYLGAFTTMQVPPVTGDWDVKVFRSKNGVYKLMGDFGGSNDNHTGDTSWTSFSMPAPVTAIGLSGMLGIGGVVGAYGKLSGSSTPGSQEFQQQCQNLSAITWLAIQLVYTVTAGTAYYQTSDAAATVRFFSNGWTENLSDYP